MPIRIKCPACGKVLDLPTADAGKSHLCPSCATRFPVPAMPPPPPMPPRAIPPPPLPDPSPAEQDIALPPQPDVPVAPLRWIYWIIALAVTASLIAILFLYSTDHRSENFATIPTPPVPTRHAATLLSTEPWWIPPPPPPTTIAATIPTTTNTLVAATIPAAAPMIARLHPIKPTTQSADTLDDQIGQSIHNGVTFLLSKFKSGRLFGYENPDDTTAGLDALALYAVLHAGEATNDLRISAHSPDIDAMLKALKTLPMRTGPATYSRSLRAAALAVYNRPEDLKALRSDVSWLLTAATNGSYTYTIPPTDQPRDSIPWDNSNSQYGALGIWAANEAGVEVPPAYWVAVQKHWLNSQLATGEWSYSAGDDVGRLSMTVAGITTLFVAQDQLINSRSTTLERPPFIPALANGLKWLEDGDHSVTLPDYYPTYNLYGLERAALASGFKYFGAHDWYRELATSALSQQQPNGGWMVNDQIVDTSFTLLFLSRGRHPIFMNKLRFDGFWANRPRDISNLTRYAAHMLQRQLNWQVVSLNSDWTDWMDSPILYIASDKGPTLTDDDCNKLRSFAENGGLIFTQADDGSDAFNKFVADLSHRLFPQYSLQDLPTDHDVYTSLFKVDPKIKLQGISNGSRLLLLNSPTDLNKAWQMRDWKDQPDRYELGLNIFIYAAGKANFRNKLHTPLVPDPGVTPIGEIKIARLKYDGNWNPEPAAWPRFARIFLGQTSLSATPIPTRFQDLNVQQTPFAHLTGTAEIQFDAAAIKSIHDYVNAGGVLLIEANNGSADFTQSILKNLLPQSFPHLMLHSLPDDHPILKGTDDCMTPIILKLRPRAAEVLASSTAPLEYLTAGKGILILSRCDLTTALLGTNTYPILGYEPDVAANLLRNTLLWTLER